MPNVRSTDMMILDDLFEMRGGYVLDFSNHTFARFFAEELNIDIDDPIYAANGDSKGRRLRCFLQTVDKQTAIRALNALWEYREVIRERSDREDKIKNAHSKFLAVISRLKGEVFPENGGGIPPKPACDREKLAQFSVDLVALSRLESQPRGYAFEKFLKEMFDFFGLKARDAFRLRGEQIDGSFELSGETYLLEAKWQNPPCDIGVLHTFHGKVEQKAAWSRGLIVSYSGFSTDALEAFGRGKRVVCMDGLDLSEVFGKELSLT